MKKKPMSLFSPLGGIKKLFLITKFSFILILFFSIPSRADKTFLNGTSDDDTRSGVSASSNILQQITVKGKVTDGSTGEALPGVSISVEGTTIGTTTDIDGNYTINLPNAKATLTFSYLGYLPENIPFNGQTALDVKLMPDIKRLEEVVVVGYGTVKKSDVTGALTSVTEQTLKERPVQNVLQALQGKASGVDVSTNIKPGELPVVTIRGNRSLQASNGPLYVVDGIPMVAGTMADMNPNDIASLEILKDASATAIYGSRGANGVVLITTKKGTKGKMNINYDGTYSYDWYHSLTDWMNGGQYVDRWRLALMNAGLYGTEKFTNFNTPVQLGYPTPALDISKLQGLSQDPTALQSVLMGYEWVDKIGGTVKTRPTTPEEQAMGWPAQVPVYNSNNVRSYDWNKQAVRTGITQNHLLSLSSGTENSNIYLSFGYLNVLGVQRDQNYERYNVTVNGDITPRKWISIGSNLNASSAVQNFGILPPNTSNTGSKDLYSRSNDQFPYALPKDTLGNWIKNPGGNLSLWNPLMDIGQAITERRVLAATLSSYAEIRFTPWIRYRLNFGSQYRQYRNGSWTGPNATSHLTNRPNTASINTTLNLSWTAENLLYINKTFNDIHNLGLTFLFSAEKNRSEGSNISASNMIYDISYWYDIASNTNGKPDNYGTNFRQTTLRSYMARLNYGLKDRYLLTASGRWDEASVLAEGHKRDFFPSFALAWKAEEESFIKPLTWISQLKVRLGFGVTGNSAVDPYTTTGPLSRNPYVFGSAPAVGFLPQQIANPNMGWEKTAQWDLGLDFAFLRNRLTGTLDLYRSNTYDLLLPRNLPPVSGYVFKIENIGKTKNRGIELTITSVNFDRRNFRWTTDVNFASNKDEIVELINGKQDMLANNYFIGYPLFVYYDFKNAGIWQNTPEDLAEMAKFNANGHKFYPGTIKVVDKNGDYRITGDDKFVRGQRFPKWTGGLTNTFGYRNWELSFFIYARIGQTYFGGYPNSYGGVFPNGRVENDLWSWTNPGGRWPMPNAGSVENTVPAMNYFDGSFVTVRHITLSYTVPTALLRRVTLSRLQAYAQILNPFIFGGDIVKFGLNPDDVTNWDRVSSNGNPLGGTNSNTVLPQSFVIGLRASL